MYVCTLREIDRYIYSLINFIEFFIRLIIIKWINSYFNDYKNKIESGMDENKV